MIQSSYNGNNFSLKSEFNQDNSYVLFNDNTHTILGAL